MNTNTGNQVHINHTTTPGTTPSAPSATARAAGIGTLFSGMAALILAGGATLGLAGGATLQAKTNVLPIGNPTPTVTTTVTATATTTVTANPAAANADTATTGSSTGPTAIANDGWLVFYRDTETVGYGGMNFGTKPPRGNTAGSEFRIGGTQGGDPYIEPDNDHTIVRLTKTGTIGPKLCKSEATSHAYQYKIMPIQKGYSYCMYLQTGSNGNLAVLLTTLEVTNNGLENSTARFSVTIWSDPSE
ncbi:hypothetical protein [Actinacidiphila soli]|uniref:hypothetical protein n=1 Tax=Actinacidiphila soli TaxID=2487275 RepID=UPI000FCB677C|nr:hypothetical protein [Actinacidiphila soli]